MDVIVGDTSAPITSMGVTADGSIFASASTALSDGSYPAKVTFRTTQVMSLLFR